MAEYHIIKNDESLWGGLYVPLRPKTGSQDGLRVVVFGSTNAGALVIGSLQKLENRNPGLIQLTGVATDDPYDPDTRISVNKRIWKYYSKEEMLLLRDRVIDLTTAGGISCYTGSVKTDYFRDIFMQWQPDVVIMCCFGQKIDSFIFNYPAFGMYNFHPSDLASKIGEGSQPFHDTMNNGKSTSVMTVHLVNEMIDKGPIVGWSPEINIRKADGDYPQSILTLQEKIPSVSGWLSVELVLEIIRKKQSGLKGAVQEVNFKELTPALVRKKLMEPANDDITDRYELPVHDCLI